MSLEKYTYNDLSIEPFIDSKQNIYFKGKEIASALGYEKTRNAVEQHVDEEDKTSYSEFAKGPMKGPPWKYPPTDYSNKRIRSILTNNEIKIRIS